MTDEPIPPALLTINLVVKVGPPLAQLADALTQIMEEFSHIPSHHRAATLHWLSQCQDGGSAP